jgi:hypothetical protein
VHLASTDGSHPYVIGELISDPSLPTVLLYAHHDVQPPGYVERWSSDPFEPVQVPTADHMNPFLVCTRAHESSHVPPAYDTGYAAVNPSGTYRGAYQFSQSTWNNTALRAGRVDLVGVDPRDGARRRPGPPRTRPLPLARRRPLDGPLLGHVEEQPQLAEPVRDKR